MKTVIRSFFFSLLLLYPFSALADRLDVFDTDKIFPIDFLFEKEVPSLKNLDPAGLDQVLQQFMDARGQVESPVQHNLLHLGISYIHLLQKNYLKALELLNQEINGKFILEDFKIYFLTVALQALAEERAQQDDLDQAIEYLKAAYIHQMTLFRDFPASPFYEDVPEILAQIEIQLGEVYFKQENYSAAWASYNKALGREYPNSEGTHLKIHTALAQTYEAGKNLNEAADIHIFLLNQFPSRQTTIAASVFLNNNLKALEEINGNVQQLKQLLNGITEVADSPTKPVARKLPKWPHSNEGLFDSLYHALSTDDFPKIVEHGERVLQEYPGDESVKGIFNHINKAILKKVQRGQWNDGMDRLLDLYPVHYINKLASLLWESGYSETAHTVYQKILDKYPAETQACHKALYFMGRIEEDNQRYAEAIEHYEKLLDKYNWGYFTPSAQFKIPWLHRLEGRLEEAKSGFEKLLKYTEPGKFRDLGNGFQEPDDFRPPALYWLADTERQLGNNDARVVSLKELVNAFPMDFYAMVARIEMSMQPLNFLEPRSIQQSSPRKWGLGEINRQRMSRAEQLISIGFLEMGMKELSPISEDDENEEFLYYLAQLFKKAGGYQRAISLSWGISRKNGHDALSPSLAEILFPKPYLEKAIRESFQYNMSPYLVLALMRQESAFNKKVVSSARAIGLMQILPTTASRVARSMGTELSGPNDLKKPDVNIQLGVKYLSGLLGDFEDNTIFALASYNAGPNKVRQWREIRSHLKPLEFMESIPYKETRNYVKKVLRNYVIYKTLYGEGGIHDFQSILTVRNN